MTSDLAGIRRSLAERTGEWAARGVGAALRLDERLVNRQDPPRPGPVPTSGLPWAQELEANWTTVRSELDGMLAAGIDFPDTDRVAGSDLGTRGRWTTYVLHWYGRRIEQNARRCPATTALVEGVPGLQVAGFTVLHPRSSVPLHQGPAKSLRYHLGIRVPDPPESCGLEVDGEVVRWHEGQGIAFDDRSHHAARNDSDEPRYVLFVQVPWPARGITRSVHHAVARAMGVLSAGVVDRAAVGGGGDGMART